MFLPRPDPSQPKPYDHPSRPVLSRKNIYFSVLLDELLVASAASNSGKRGMSAVRHSAQTMLRAQRLAGDGYCPAEIVRVLQRAGISVAEVTIRRWVQPEFHERRLKEKAAAARHKRAEQSGGQLQGKHTLEFRTTRIHALRQLGLSKNAIALVMTFDFPDAPLTRSQVDGMLERGYTPRTMRAAA